MTAVRDRVDFLLFLLYNGSMKKLDYFAKNSFSDPASPYDVHWWYNRTTDYHCHVDYYELFLTISGGLIQYYNGKCSPLEPQTIYLIPKMQYHRIDYIRKEGHANIFNLSVRTNFFEHCVDTYSSPLSEEIRGENCLSVRLNNAAYEFMLMLSRKVTYDEDAGDRLQAVRLFLATCATLFRPHEAAGTNASGQYRYAVDIKSKIDNLEYIEEDITGIYARYPLTPSLLIKGFKELTGKTIVKYQVERRMKYACSLLSNTDYTVLHISSAVGYDSLSHFTDNFKKYTGMTPSAYRKENTPAQLAASRAKP